jgi:phosphatidylinositol-3-phosphatase
MSALGAPFRRAVAAAATLTGRRFGLLVASSLVATSAIVASALTNPSGIGPLAALLGRSMASDNAPVASGPAPGPSRPHNGPSRSSGGSPDASAGGPPAPLGTTPSPEASSPESEGEEATPSAPTEPALQASRIKHVFVVSLTSPGYEASFGTASQMPYLSATLRPQGELLSKYSLLDEKPVANDLAAVGGQKPNARTKAGCAEFDDCVLPVEVATIADQLTIGHLTWKAYMGGMADSTGKPDSCVYPAAEEPYPPAEGGYTATRNPFVFFHSLLDLGDCAINDVPLPELQGDLRKADSTAAYSFIAPGLCDSGSTVECPAGRAGGPAAADAFLAEWVPKILSSAAYKADGMLIVTFDQIDPVLATPEAAPTPPLQVGTLLLSRFLSPGSTDAKPYDPYSLLRSTEDVFGLQHLGAADAAKTRTFTTAVLGEEGGGD